MVLPIPRRGSQPPLPGDGLQKHMNALLIFPEGPDTGASFYHFRESVLHIHLWGCSRLLPYCLPHWAKRLIDTNVRALKDCDFAWADVALISGMLVQKDNSICHPGAVPCRRNTYSRWWSDCQRFRGIALLRRSRRDWRGRGTGRSTCGRPRTGHSKAAVQGERDAVFGPQPFARPQSAPLSVNQLPLR